MGKEIQKPKVMKKYSHDYSKVAEAESMLCRVQRLMANESYNAALERVNEAREILLTYLSGDNMVEDSDVYDGWCKSYEVDQELEQEGRCTPSGEG